MVDRVIAIGLRSLGAATATPLPAKGRLDTSGRVTIPMSPSIRSTIEHLAVDQDRSRRAMTVQVIKAGLHAMGAWPR